MVRIVEQSSTLFQAFYSCHSLHSPDSSDPGVPLYQNKSAVQRIMGAGMNNTMFDQSIKLINHLRRIFNINPEENSAQVLVATHNLNEGE